MVEALQLANIIAPEHVELIVRQPEKWARGIRNAGAIFLGPYSTPPLGDYLAGPNHVLPTGGSARFFSPLGTYDFLKRTTIIQLKKRRCAPWRRRLLSSRGSKAWTTMRGQWKRDSNEKEKPWDGREKPSEKRRRRRSVSSWISTARVKPKLKPACRFSTTC